MQVSMIADVVDMEKSCVSEFVDELNPLRVTSLAIVVSASPHRQPRQSKP